MLPGLLLLDTAALLVAPLLAWAVRRAPPLEAFVHALAQVVVGGLVLVHVIPFGVTSAGWPALAAVLAGAAAGSLVHRLPSGETAARGLAILALAVHNLVDGVAFAGGGDGDRATAWAVITHSVPVGLATWRVGEVVGGRRLGLGLLAVGVGATWLGWAGAETLLAGLPQAALALTQCAVAGGLLHVIGHLGEGRDGGHRAAGLGALAGVGAVALLAAEHPLPRISGHIDAASALFTLAAEAAPALLGGYALSLLLVRTAAAVERALLRRGPWGTGLTAFALPGSSCGVLPLVERLPLRADSAAALLLAGPGLGPGTLFVSFALLGLPFTLLRAASTVVAAGLVGWLVGPRAATRPAHAHEEERGPFALIEHSAPWMVAGLLVAALVEALLPAGALAGIPAPLAVGAAVLLALPPFVCATGVTPLAWVLLHKGLGAGAVLAFLIAGTGAHAASFRSFSTRYGRATAWRQLGGVAGVAGLCGLVADQLPVPVRDLHLRALHDHPASELAALAALPLLFAAALLRAGPAGFLEPMLHAHLDDDDHAHG